MNKESKNIMLLLLRGQTTNFGNIIFDYANKVVIAGLAVHSSFFMMVYQTSESLIRLCLNLFAGHFADFNNRKKLLISTDLIAGIATFLLYLFYDSKNIWSIVFVNVLLAVLFSFNAPAYKAIIKDLLSKEGIKQYNSLSKIIAEILGIGAPLISVFVIHQFGFKYGMLINSISFFISALCEYSFHVFHIANHNSNGLLSSIKNGFKYIYQDKILLIILVSTAFLNFLDAIYSFYLPFTSVFSNFHHIFAYILVAQSLGSIFGASVIGFYKKELSPETFFHLLVPGAISLILIGFVTFSQILLLILFAIFSTTVSMFNVNLMSHLQVNIDSHFLGRVFSIIFTISGIFIPFGSFFASYLSYKNWHIFQFIGLGQFLIYISCLLILRLIKRNIKINNSN